ncbi:MAG: hypothetical protein ACOCV1_04620 [Bacillota bacterium]
MKHFITVDPTKRNKKDGDKVPQIQQKLNTTLEVNIKSAAQYFSQPFGYSWCPATFNIDPKKGRIWRSKANFKQSSVIGLDFDNSPIDLKRLNAKPVTPDDIIKKFKGYGITPNLYYTTFSDSEKQRKFRVILFLNTVITDKDQYETILKGLMKLFPLADKSCKDSSRFFFGGNKSEILNTNEISLDELVNVLKINEVALDSGQTRNLKKYEKLHFNRRTINIYNSDAVKMQKSKKNLGSKGVEGGSTQKNIEIEVIRDFDFDYAVESIKILKDFAEGNLIHYTEFFAIATNMKWIEGGLKWMRNKMIEFNLKNHNKEHVFDELTTLYEYDNGTKYNNIGFAIVSTLQSKEGTQYLPTRLENFSPYKDDWKYLNIRTINGLKKGEIIQLKPIKKMKLEEAEKKMKAKFEDVIKKNDNNIYIFKLPTGIGKTELLANNDLKALIAAPTNKLKSEIATRCNYPVTETPNLILSQFDDEYFTSRLEYLYSTGCGREAYKALLDKIDEDFFSNNRTDSIRIRNYFYNLARAYEEENTVITTHSRSLLNDKFKHNTIIFDEDPLNHLLPIETLSLADVKKLFGRNDRLNQYLFDFMRDINSNSATIRRTPIYSMKVNTLIEAVINIDVTSNMIDFFTSDFMFVDTSNKDGEIHYIKRRHLPEDKKIIIMSATIPVAIYKALYGKRVKVIDISDVENTGEIIQYTKNSYSRSSFQGTDGKEVINKIVNRVNNLKVITHSKFKNYFKNPVENMHFGNTAGYDELKGENIAVVGTPHLPLCKYALLGMCIGLDMKTIDYQMMRYKTIEYNNFRFRFTTFNHPVLRKIQLSLIESELIQAAGRNRVLREKVKTEIYSNLPLRISDKFINN